MIKMLETKDLILHAGSADDYQDLHKNLWSHPEVFTYMFGKPCADENSAKLKTEAYSNMHNDNKTEFFVYDKKLNQAIGIAGIKELSSKKWTVTDIAIGTEFQGRGYGKQILCALTELAFEKCGAEQLSYDCFSQNTVSDLLALSCGYTLSEKNSQFIAKPFHPASHRILPKSITAF